MNILVTGANGFVGSHLCPYLINRGHQVREATRKDIGELSGNTDWTDILKGVDIVVHLAAKVHVLQAKEKDTHAFTQANVNATQHLIEQAVNAGVKRFVFVSTIGVHGNASQHPLNEKSPIVPAGAYAQSKWAAEQSIRLQHDIEHVILRPPLVYGPGVKANFLRLMTAVYQQKRLPFAAVQNKRDYLSLENFCSAIEWSSTSSNVANQTFLLCDGEPLSTGDLIARLAQQLNCKATTLAVPQKMLKLAFYLSGKASLYHSVCGSRIVDGSAIRSCGWRPPQTADEGLHQTVQWFLKEYQ